MAQIQRQNNFFAAEDFRTIYRTFSEINFTAYDFDTIKRAMIEYLQRHFPEEFNDFIESSEFIAIIELLAYMGQTIAFRQDLNTRENFLDTAERTESIRRLAKMLNYTPKRNLPAAGVIKIFAVSTDEQIIDSAGNDLSNLVINWNDPNNVDYLEQLTLILNAAFLAQNPYGTPVKKGTVDAVPIEVYTIDAIKNLAVTYSLNGDVNGASFPFEVVNATFEDGMFMKEIEPNPANGLSMFYINDGLGNNSSQTGFFMYLKQGALSFDDFALDLPQPNREIFINKENINNFDVWCQTVDSTGTILDSWTKVPSVNGTSVVYNSLLKNKRKIFAVTSAVNDKISLRFADGSFGDAPSGTTRVWYRQSANLTTTARPEDIGLQTIQVPYIGKNNTTHILSITLGLVGSISNSLATETNAEIKTNAPQVFYTQDRMVNGEDYNTYPLYKNSDIIKIKAINRTHAGHSRFIDINDPTGTVQNLNVFAEDGFIYKDEQNIQVVAELTSSTTSNTIIQRYVQPQLSEDDVINFYYDVYRKAVHTADGSSAWRFTTSEVMQWVTLPSSTDGNKGYFVKQDVASIATNYQTVGTSGTGKNKFIVEKSLLEFQNSARSLTLFATVENLTVSGNPTGLTTGPIELNVSIPDGYILTRVYPKFRKLFNTTEQTAIFTQLDLKNTFGIGYDYKTSAFYVINPNNLSTATEFSLVNAQDNTNTNKDDSWIIKIEYVEATSLTSANFSLSTRGMRYIFESEEDVRFYFDNAFKTVDVKTGQAKRDVISLLKINSDKRSQIDRINILTPGNGYTSSPVVEFQQPGEIDPATAVAQLSWNFLSGGIGGSEYAPIDPALTYLDSVTVDSNGIQNEIMINNSGVLNTATGGRSLRLKANLSESATALPTIADDTISDIGIELFASGAGYTSLPTIAFPAPAGGGITALGYATIDTALTGATITDQGGGYITTPDVTVNSPGFSGTVWNVNHGLNQKYVNYEIIVTSGGNDLAIDHIYSQPTVEFIDENNLKVTWDSNTIGYIDIIKSKFVSPAQLSTNEWIINHNLGEQYPNIDVVYTEGSTDISAQGRFDHPIIEYTSTTQCKIKFPANVTKAGYVVVTHNLGNNGATGTGFNFTTGTPAGIWNITHNLGKKHVNVDIAKLGSALLMAGFASPDATKYYNIRGHYDAPTITFVDDNNLTITWITPTAGKATISCGTALGTQAIGVAHMAVGDDTGTPTLCAPVTINNGGAGYTAGNVLTVSGGDFTGGTAATITVNTVDGGGAITGATLLAGGDYITTAGGIAVPVLGGLGATFDLNWKVISIAFSPSPLTGGGGYQSLPTITIGAPPAGTAPCVSRQATATATQEGTVTGITVTNSGSGYTSVDLPAIITFTGGGYSTIAQARATTLNSSITAVTMINTGSGYTQGSPPTVIFTTAPIGGTSTTGTATVNATGNVTGIVIGNTGNGYYSRPLVTISGDGTLATATCTVNASGIIDTITITGGGSGYTSATVAFSGNTGINGTGTVTITGGAVTAVIINNGGTGWTPAPVCTIANSGSIRSVDIIDPGFGYTGRPLISYAETTNGTGASTINIDGFVSHVEITDPGNGYTSDTTVSFSTPTGDSPVTTIGTPVIKLNQNLETDIKFNLSKLLTYSDGYQDPRKVLVTFHDNDGDGIPDDPLSFDKFVDVARYLFEETYTDFDGYTYYKLSRNVLQADTQAEENVIIQNASTYAGKYIYRTDLKVFKKIASVTPYGLTTLTNATDGTLKLSAFIGRSGYNTPKVNSSDSTIANSTEEKIFFQWKHYAPTDQRVDPSVTNLIDIFILTKTYYDNVLSWKANNKTLVEFPAPPTNTELSISFNNLNNYKSISDQIIYRPVKFKLLFGSMAITELQATFKVIKTLGSDISDNEVKSQVIEAINRFFLLNNWDMGESFYYTELAAFIHQSMPTNISSVALVPTNSESNFGNLFQVKAEVDELFLPVAKVTDIDVVKGFTEQNLKIR
jgi:hypothetical protein